MSSELANATPPKDLNEPLNVWWEEIHLGTRKKNTIRFHRGVQEIESICIKLDLTVERSSLYIRYIVPPCTMVKCRWYKSLFDALNELAQLIHNFFKSRQIHENLGLL